MAPPTQVLSIVLFKGGTQDDKNNRHCALLIEHIGEDGLVWERNMIDIEGYGQNWSRRESWGRNPEGSKLFLAKIKLKTIYANAADPWNDHRLRASIWNVGINNVDEEWNCQKWLEDALKRLTAAKYITSEEAEISFGQALDIILWN